ncbi:hypothetical protein B9Z55_004679 [Caenorhabditis nigoni]|uniref:Sdz-33 F-box domain-containing protein n=1 Tax=Caenorhabditis nigoni TaxID=1611254 RepID=A0A2G5UXJ1_9PELO|nr:hypothetical protein B9Z55_004679 [Caenorhabditis nigoni]
MLSLNGESSYIHFPDEGVTIFCGSQQIESADIVTSEIVTNLDIAPWLNPKLCAVENTIEVCGKIRKMLNPCPCFDISLHLENLDSLNIQKILAIPHLMPSQIIEVFSSEIDKADLDLIMEKGSDALRVLLYVKKFPDSYYHDHAFKFNSFQYDDAHWVKIEHLLSFRCRTYVTLNNCPFTPVDLNRLIKHWINGDADMFQHLILNCIDSRPTGFTEILIDGLVTLRTFVNGRSLHLFAIAIPSLLRRYKLLSCWRGANNRITFSAIPIKVKHAHHNMPPRIGKLEYQILRRLNSKKKLQDEIVEKRENNPRDRSILQLEEKIQEIDRKLIMKGVNLDFQVPILPEL